MVWTGDARYRLAPALLTLLHQLEAAYPGQGWLNSPQTGTIGDVVHQAESSSDHNPFLDRTVRALDVAANVSGVPGIQTVTDAPNCEALFAMVNAMYAARDPRVWPNGYAIYLRRVTDWDHPGGYHAQVGDPHLYHLHISVSQNPAGFNSTEPWPLLQAAPPPPVKPPTTTTPEGPVYHVIRNVTDGSVRACGPNFWAALEGATRAETLANISLAVNSPLCASVTVQDVSPARMQWYHDFYLTGKVK